MVKQRFTGHTVGEMNIISETRVCIQLVRPLQLVQVVKQWFTGCTVGDFYNIEYTLCLVCSAFYAFTVEVPLTDTLVSGQLYLRPPCLKPCFNSHTNSVFLHSRKQKFPHAAADTFRDYDLDFFFVFKIP